MIRSFKIRFLHMKRRGQPLFSDERIDLIPREYHRVPYTLEDCDVYIFDICEQGRIAGEIALRMGEGDALYYLGHIGYHVDPPFRGHHDAARACELVKPVFREYGMRSFVITTDVDNLPSIKTCERIGCLLESMVSVPKWCRIAYQCSSVKNRFVFQEVCS